MLKLNSTDKKTNIFKSIPFSLDLSVKIPCAYYKRRSYTTTFHNNKKTQPAMGPEVLCAAYIKTT